MKNVTRIFSVLIIIALFLPSCLKSTTTHFCLVTSANLGSRKLALTYVSSNILYKVEDFSDSTSVGTLSTADISYNYYEQVSSVYEKFENGDRDSVAFDYSTNLRIKQAQYVLTNNVMTLNTQRNYVMNATGEIASDTLYGQGAVKGASSIISYSTYEYNTDGNLHILANFSAAGNLNYSITYEYTTIPVKTNSYNVAKFTFLAPYSGTYQYIFPQMSLLPLKITLSTGSVVTSYTYDLDNSGNVLAEHFTPSNCTSCTKTINYQYHCQ